MSPLMMAAAVLAAAISVFVFLAWALQRKLIYFPSGDAPPPHAVGLLGVAPVTFHTDDGLTLHGWFVRPDEPAWFTVIVFNGNAGNRAMRAPLAVALRRHGLAVLLFDYRGFGGNPGVPTERGLIADARAARRYVAGRRDVDPARVAYFGESLGAAVAIQLAAEVQPAGLVLRSPFGSLAEAGRFHYPFLPVRWLLRDRFASNDVIGRIHAPLLMVAGDRDRIVPLDHTRRLFAEATDPKTLVIISDADHNDASLLYGGDMIAHIVTFLRGSTRRGPTEGGRGFGDSNGAGAAARS
jgi:fermentation-respiration switch protein FrsA (DUF1100 family)